MKMSAVRIIDALMACRPVLLIPVWGFSALGYRCATGAGGSAWFLRSNHPADFNDYLLLLVFSLSVAAVYLMNQLADITVDKNNRGLPLIARGIVGVRTAWISVVLLSTAACIIPLMLGGFTVFVCSSSALLLGVVYSFRPLRFSGRPFLDFLSNAFGYGIIAFGAGWFTGGEQPYSLNFLLHALPYFFLMCGGSISSTLPDMEGDRTDQKTTTAIYLGAIRAHLLAMLFLCFAGVTGFLMKDAAIVICSTAALPFYIGYLIFQNDFFMEATYKIGGALSMLAAIIAMPYFIPAALVVFIATWLYFRIRHGIAYPSLVPVK